MSGQMGLSIVLLVPLAFAWAWVSRDVPLPLWLRACLGGFIGIFCYETAGWWLA